MSSDMMERAAETERGVEYYQQYKSISSAAVASTILGLLSIAAFFAWALLIVPIIAAILGFYGLRKVRARPDEFTGDGLARFGIISGLFFLVAGSSWLSYEYATEVPEGYARISYEDLQPDPERPSQLLPQSAKDLDGRQVFIKGYVFPSKKMDNIRQFILCRDKGDCCFGGNPKLTDRIQVTLLRGLRLNYTTKLYKLAGTFRLSPSQASDMEGGVIYHLDADMLK